MVGIWISQHNKKPVKDLTEGTLGVHEIELVVDAGEGLGDGRGVGDHAHGALHAGKIPPGNDRGGLVVDAAFEPSRAPVDELDGPLGLDGGDGSLRNNGRRKNF